MSLPEKIAEFVTLAKRYDPYLDIVFDKFGQYWKLIHYFHGRDKPVTLFEFVNEETGLPISIHAISTEYLKQVLRMVVLTQGRRKLKHPAQRRKERLEQVKKEAVPFSDVVRDNWKSQYYGRKIFIP